MGKGDTYQHSTVDLKIPSIPDLGSRIYTLLSRLFASICCQCAATLSIRHARKQIFVGILLSHQKRSYPCGITSNFISNRVKRRFRHKYIYTPISQSCVLSLSLSLALYLSISLSLSFSLSLSLSLSISLSPSLSLCLSVSLPVWLFSY